MPCTLRTAAVAGLLLLAGSQRSLAGPASPLLTFAPCDASYGLTNAFECGTLPVPIDHADPSGGTIDLWVSRRPANTNTTTASTRSTKGTLLFNFGGPGIASSFFFQLQAAGLPIFANNILDHFDLVAVDPRGVRYSAPVTCDADLWNQEPSIYDAVASDEAFAELVAYNKKLGESCLKGTQYGTQYGTGGGNGSLLHHLDRASVATDFELIRRALGVETIHYLGLSYGTLLGQAYAAMYGDHVDGMVLDAVLDRPLAGNNIASTMATGASFDATLRAVFAWCNATGSADDCALYGQDQAAIFQKLTAPIPGAPASLPAGCDTCTATVTRSHMLRNTVALVSYFGSSSLAIAGSWATFASDLQTAYYSNNASAFASTRETNNTDTAYGSQFLYRATLCQDLGSPLQSAADLRYTLGLSGIEQPLARGMGVQLEAAAFCAGWPVGVKQGRDSRFPEQIKQRVKRPGSVVLVNAFVDPATPAQFAMALGQRLRPASVNIWRDGAGHTSYVLGGETTAAINAFLVNGTALTDGAVYYS